MITASQRHPSGHPLAPLSLVSILTTLLLLTDSPLLLPEPALHKCNGQRCERLVRVVSVGGETLRRPVCQLEDVSASVTAA